jgi:hypothetical protein
MMRPPGRTSSILRLGYAMRVKKRFLCFGSWISMSLLPSLRTWVSEEGRKGASAREGERASGRGRRRLATHIVDEQEGVVDAGQLVPRRQLEAVARAVDHLRRRQRIRN